MPHEESDIVLVAMELGSRWPEWMTTEHSFAPNRVVVAQDPGEAASDFAARVVKRIARIAAAGQRIVTAVVAAGHSVGGACVAARCRIVQALARASSSLYSAHVVFSVDDRSSDGVRHDAAGLARALESELSDVGVRVSLAGFSAHDDEESEPVFASHERRELLRSPAEMFSLGA